MKYAEGIKKLELLEIAAMRTTGKVSEMWSRKYKELFKIIFSGDIK